MLALQAILGASGSLHHRLPSRLCPFLDSCAGSVRTDTESPVFLEPQAYALSHCKGTPSEDYFRITVPLGISVHTRYPRLIS